MEVKRDIYLNKLISKKYNGLIKVVTGIRRCGKSYLLFHLFKGHLLAEGVDEQHIIEIAFDSFENKRFRDPEVLYPYLKEQRSLMLNGDFFKEIIITKDAPAPYYNDDGVLVMSVYDFLPNVDSLDN